MQFSHRARGILKTLSYSGLLLSIEQVQFWFFYVSPKTNKVQKRTNACQFGANLGALPFENRRSKIWNKFVHLSLLSSTCTLSLQPVITPHFKHTLIQTISIGKPLL